MGARLKGGFLLDSNHLGSAVTRNSSVRLRIDQARITGVRFGTCIPVLCEIEAGVQQVRRPDEYRENLRRLLRYVSIWPLDQETARLYGEFHQKLRKKGRVLSQVDMMIAALAYQMGLKVLTTDGDFDALPEIRKENWLQA
ncbi:MAG TPA: type II toxin-antitoxin system VapC family toxin [Thermoanaerobaculia bacterium]|nr:type II toxin-antitoxin system VapC family toxin [Thermoanaerobaculia bacterium]